MRNITITHQHDKNRGSTRTRNKILGHDFRYPTHIQLYIPALANKPIGISLSIMRQAANLTRQKSIPCPIKRKRPSGRKWSISWPSQIFSCIYIMLKAIPVKLFLLCKYDKITHYFSKLKRAFCYSSSYI